MPSAVVSGAKAARILRPPHALSSSLSSSAILLRHNLPLPALTHTRALHATPRAQLKPEDMHPMKMRRATSQRLREKMLAEEAERRKQADAKAETEAESDDSDVKMLDVIEQVRKREPIIKSQGHDPWGYETVGLDVMIPKPFTSFRYADLSARFQNMLKNVASTYLLASQGFGQIIHRRRRLPFALDPRLLRYGSTSPNAWTAPIIRDCIEVYKNLNTAVTKGDTFISTFARGDALQHFRALARKFAEKPCKWTFHELREARIVSLRTAPAHYGREATETGSRLLVQALLKIRSMQSMKQPGDKSEEKPREVVEYLVFERHLWKPDSKWQIREQVHEDL